MTLVPKAAPPKRLVGCDLIDFAARDAAGFASMCEAGYNARLDAVAEAALQSGARLIMLTGPSAAGKTTSARKLAGRIQAAGRRSQVVSLDDFFVGEGRYPKQPDGTDDYECVEALDLPVLRRCLRSLAETGECDTPIFNFLTQRPDTATRHIDCRGGIAIVEGLHAFNPALNVDSLPAGAAIHVYAGLREEYAAPDGSRVLATRDVRLARRLTRDLLFRGHGADFTLRLWPHVCLSEDRYIKAFKPRADLVLDTSFSYEVCLWEHYIQRMTASEHIGRLRDLGERFAVFTPLPGAVAPADSMLREFIGEEKGSVPETGKY